MEKHHRSLTEIERKVKEIKSMAKKITQFKENSTYEVASINRRGELNYRLTFKCVGIEDWPEKYPGILKYRSVKLELIKIECNSSKEEQPAMFRILDSYYREVLNLDCGYAEAEIRDNEEVIKINEYCYIGASTNALHHFTFEELL